MVRAVASSAFKSPALHCLSRTPLLQRRERSVQPSDAAPRQVLNPLRPTWNIGNIAVHAPAERSLAGSRPAVTRNAGAPPLPIQPKLEVGAADSPLEREADRVAQQVMRQPGPDGAAQRSITHGGSRLERKCACGGTCAKCKGEDSVQSHGGLHRKAEASQMAHPPGSSANSGIAAPPIVHTVLNSPGQPLDAATRAYFEPRFGYDFSHVRLHQDSRAAESASAVDALAYTVGNHIALGRDHGSRDTESGRSILAHELAHVVQQENAPTPALHRLSVRPLRQHLWSNGAGCGDEHFIEWDFQLDNPAPCDGYIVQQVDLYEDIHEDCNHCPASAPHTPTTFWEAWWVEKGETLQDLRSPWGAIVRMLHRPHHDYQGTTFTDRASITHRQGTCGVSTATGTIKFFCANAAAPQGATGDLGKEDQASTDPHSAWSPNRLHHGTSSGWLPATDAKPPFWDKSPVEGPETRLLTSSWHCCVGQPAGSVSFATPFRLF
jgi:hypothetical protein